MPGRISAFKLREIDGIDARSNLCIGIDARSNSVKNETIHIYKYNIPFIDKYFIRKNQQSCTMKLKYIWEANRPVILNYYNFEFFNIFCLQSQLSGCIMHRLVEYSSKKEKN